MIRAGLTKFDVACFLGALQAVARSSGKKDAAANAKIHSSVSLGHSAEIDGFGLKVELKVEGVEDEELIKAAHEVHLSSSGGYSLTDIHPS